MAGPGVKKFEFPDLQVVHVLGFNISPDNPVTGMYGLLRDELNFDISKVWNCSGRTQTKIVELLVVKSAVKEFFKAFEGNSFGLIAKISERILKTDEETMQSKSTHILYQYDMELQSFCSGMNAMSGN